MHLYIFLNIWPWWFVKCVLLVQLRLRCNFFLFLLLSLLVFFCLLQLQFFGFGISVYLAGRSNKKFSEGIGKTTKTSVLLAFPLYIIFSHFFFVHQTAAQNAQKNCTKNCITGKKKEKEGNRKNICLLYYRMQLHIMQCNNVMYVYHKKARMVQQQRKTRLSLH